ncbi:hypothetical protein GVAV_000241 [Gurleya vavrai]
MNFLEICNIQFIFFFTIKNIKGTNKFQCNCNKITLTNSEYIQSSYKQIHSFSILYDKLKFDETYKFSNFAKRHKDFYDFILDLNKKKDFYFSDFFSKIYKEIFFPNLLSFIKLLEYSLTINNSFINNTHNEIKLDANTNSLEIMVNYIYDQIFESSSKILRIYENMNFRNIDDIKLNTALKKSYDSVLKYDKNFKNLKLSQVEVDYIKAVFDEKYINAFSNEVFFNYKLRMIIRYTFQSFEFSFFNLINEYNTIFFIETTPDPILNNYYVKSNFFEKTIIKIEDIFNINKTVWMNKDKPFKQFFNFQKISFELKKQIEFFYETNKFYTDNAILTKIEAWIMKNTILYECFDDLYVFLSDDLELNDVFICIGYQISRLNSLFYDYYKKIESDQKNPKKFNLKEIELSLKTKNLTAMQIISTKIRSIFSSNLTKLFTNEKLQSYDNDIKESFFEKFQSDAFIILNHFNLFKNTKLSKRIPNKSLGIYEGNLASYCKKNNSQFNLIETQQKKILNDFSYKLNKLDEINNKNKSIKTSVVLCTIKHAF